MQKTLRGLRPSTRELGCLKYEYSSHSLQFALIMGFGPILLQMTILLPKEGVTWQEAWDEEADAKFELN